MDQDYDSCFVTEITDFQAKMRAYLAKLLANSSSTDDVLQESNKILWLKRQNWDPETPFLKWAYRICYFQAKAYLRDMSRDRLVFREELIDLLAEDHPNDTSMNQREGALKVCLQKLSSKQRTLILQHYESGSSLQEIADKLGITSNSLSQRLCRLRHRLHLCIQQNIPSQSP